MIGDIYIDDGVAFEVVWAGREGLLPSRPSKQIYVDNPPEKRRYNRKDLQASPEEPEDFPIGSPLLCSGALFHLVEPTNDMIPEFETPTSVGEGLENANEPDCDVNAD